MWNSHSYYYWWLNTKDIYNALLKCVHVGTSVAPQQKSPAKKTEVTDCNSSSGITCDPDGILDGQKTPINLNVRERRSLAAGTFEYVSCIYPQISFVAVICTSNLHHDFADFVQ